MLKPPSDKINAETRTKLLALADFIEADDRYALQMYAYFNPHRNGQLLPEAPPKNYCGTSACIAGYVGIQASLPVKVLNAACFDAATYAAGQLGLTDDQKSELFYEYSGNPTRTKAVRVLRNFAYTGDVDWKV